MSFSALFMAFRHLLRMRCYRRVLRQIFRKDLEIPVTSALMELLRKEDLTRDAWDGFRAIPVGLVWPQGVGCPCCPLVAGIGFSWGFEQWTSKWTTNGRVLSSMGIV